MEFISSKVIRGSDCSTAMEMISLDPVEDAFLELGAIGGSGDSDGGTKLKNWKDGIDWSKTNSIEQREEGYCNCKTILSQKDRAYLQFMIDENGHDETKSDLEYLSTALVLEIEVGDGSWESSLIQNTFEEDGKADTVSFILLPTWKIER